MTAEKLCKRCGQIKPISDFSKDSSTKTGIRSWCRICCNIRCRKWEKANKELRKEYSLKSYYRNRDKRLAQKKESYNYEKQSATNRQRLYGLLPEQYERMVQNQNDLCAICHESNITRRGKAPLFVDHDHATGSVRELLCHFCNAGIGYFKEDVSLMMAAIEYIKKHKAVLNSLPDTDKLYKEVLQTNDSMPEN